MTQKWAHAGEARRVKEGVALRSAIGDLEFAMGSESRLGPHCGRFEILEYAD